MNLFIGRKKEKPRTFFFHYNKPASQQAKAPRISVHWKDACHIVHNVKCDVPCEGRINNRQPYWVMKGRGVLSIIHDVAYITSS
jgi:hypothetical protein